MLTIKTQFTTNETGSTKPRIIKYHIKKNHQMHVCLPYLFHDQFKYMPDALLIKILNKITNTM